MRTFRIPWNELLTVAALLGCAPLMAQPYVTVPVGANITIVSPGAGTPGVNQIGNGGIVAMKDPDTAGGLFSIAGVTSVTWSLLGDISIGTTNVPPAAGVYTTTGLTATIETYNKLVRTPAETTLPETNDHARSKGQVRINYTSGACGGEFRFDIFKKWGPATTTTGANYAPPIVGPNCWPPPGGPLITYSVDQVSSDNALDAIGFDQYYWSVTKTLPSVTLLPSTAFYTSADRSSITINTADPTFTGWYTGAAGGVYTIKCEYGRANNWDGGTNLARSAAGVTFVTKTINVPLVPAYTGGFPPCVNAVTPALPIAVNSSNYNANYTYSWTRTNLAWVFTPNGSGGITINSIGNGDPCTFILTVTPINPAVYCGASTFSYTVNRNYNFTAASLGSPFCTSPGANILTVNLPVSAQGNQTCWGPLPAGWTVAPVGSSGGVFTIPTGAAGSTNTIQMFSCGACSAVQVPIVINVRPGTPVVTAVLPTTTCVPSGGGPNQTFSATSAGANATSFAWTNTLGMTEIAPTNDATGVFNPVGTASGTLSVITTNIAGCPSIAGTLLVNRDAVAPVVVQPTCYTLGYDCAGTPGLPGSSSFTINAANFTQNGTGTYTWTFPPNTFFNSTGVAVVVTQGTNTAVVRPTTGVPNSVVTGYYSFTVQFTPASGCASASTTVTISGGLGVVTYNNNGTGPGTLGQLLAPVTPFGTNSFQEYDCSVPGTIGSIFTTGSIPLNTVLPVGTGSLTMNIIVPGGCIWRPAPVVTSHKSLVLVDDNGNEQLANHLQGAEAISVMPNPNEGTFVLRIDKDFTTGSVSIVDGQGKVIGVPERVMKGQNQMDYQGLVPGFYSLLIALDGKTQVQRIVVVDHQ